MWMLSFAAESGLLLVQGSRQDSFSQGGSVLGGFSAWQG